MSALDRPPLAERVALLVATVGGAGYAPVAPGTVGTAVAVLLLWVLPFSRPVLAACLVVVTLVGTWAADRAERALGAKDPGAIVVDEVAGMALAALPFPLTLPTLLAGFVLFRFFDVVKPPPAGASQHIPGGVGVMVDDLIAGAYAALALGALRALTGWP